MDIGQRLREMHDDAVELQKLDPQQPDPANLAAQIDAYLSGKLIGHDMKKLSDEYGPQIDAEMLRREQTVQGKKELDEKNALRIFNGVYTDKEEADARRACSEFGQKHPILSIVKNQLTLLEEVANRKQLVTVPNLEAAYKFLCSQGAFEEPIEPVQSAAEFKAAHIEDWPEEGGIPPLILQGIARALDTWSLTRPEYLHTDANKDKIVAALKNRGAITVQAIEEAFQECHGELELTNASQRGELVTVTDLGGYPPGYPRQPIKPSFRKLVRELTADELKQKMLDDKNFEIALDNLK